MEATLHGVSPLVKMHNVMRYLVMPNRSRKPPEDENEAAHRILEAVTGDKPPKEKNPAAVALGRLGGLKGGKARAAKLSHKRRRDIARKAAAARWKAQK